MHLIVYVISEGQWEEVIYSLWHLVDMSKVAELIRKVRLRSRHSVHGN